MKTRRQQDEDNERAIADGERRYAASFEDTTYTRDEYTSCCQDCGESGVSVGHMGCQYPENH